MVGRIRLAAGEPGPPTAAGVMVARRRGRRHPVAGCLVFGDCVFAVCGFDSRPWFSICRRLTACRMVPLPIVPELPLSGRALKLAETPALTADACSLTTIVAKIVQTRLPYDRKPPRLNWTWRWPQ
jgi:hypothetical protein